MAHPYGSYPGMQGQQAYPPAAGGWTPPGVSPEVFQWFQTVDTDRSGRITANELQAALTNANWSQFNIATCRLMIGMFDRDNSGKIDLNEFQALWNYINQWRVVYEQFDRDRSGHINANELCLALNQMGYRVNPQTSQNIVWRYDAVTRQGIAMDNFIQVCVLIKNVTETFRQKDTQMQGTIRLSYEEFMFMSLLNKA